MILSAAPTNHPNNGLTLSNMSKNVKLWVILTPLWQNFRIMADIKVKNLFYFPNNPFKAFPTSSLRSPSSWALRLSVNSE